MLPVYFINIDASVDRRRMFEGQTASLGINASRFSAITPDTVSDYCITTDGLAMQPGELGCLLSHLEVIRQFATEPILVFEDDVSFEPMEYWGFTLDEIIDLIPAEWSIVQLAVFPSRSPISFKKWNPRELMWGNVAYIVTPRRREELMAHYKDGKWDLHSLPSFIPTRPIADAVCYKDTNSYSIPLFSIHESIISDIWGKNLNGFYGRYTMDLWKTEGSNLQIIKDSMPL